MIQMAVFRDDHHYAIDRRRGLAMMISFLDIVSRRCLLFAAINFEDWILFVLDGVEQTAMDTIQTITQIQSLLLKQKHQIRKNYKFYTQDLLNNLFKHPYTKIEFVEKDLKVSRISDDNYLNALSNVNDCFVW